MGFVDVQQRSDGAIELQRISAVACPPENHVGLECIALRDKHLGIAGQMLQVHGFWLVASGDRRLVGNPNRRKTAGELAPLQARRFDGFHALTSSTPRATDGALIAVPR
jgi:hypothetical protein